jgi:hypothetical protein
VRFIVQAADDILKKDFGLPHGLADSSTVTRGHAPLLTQTYHRVQILVSWAFSEWFPFSSLPANALSMIFASKRALAAMIFDKCSEIRIHCPS